MNHEEPLMHVLESLLLSVIANIKNFLPSLIVYHVERAFYIYIKYVFQVSLLVLVFT